LKSIEDYILTAIKSKPRGTLLFPDDYKKMASSEGVRQALKRLAEKNEIKRIAQGIYVRPKQNEFIGEIIPTAEEVAVGIAKRDKIRIIPTGVFALNALGLSTQIPMKLVYLTDGSPREIQIGKRSIKFKKTTPKALSVKGTKSALVVQVLREIGKDKVREDELQKIHDVLKSEDVRNLKHDIQLVPDWIRKIMEKALYE